MKIFFLLCLLLYVGCASVQPVEVHDTVWINDINTGKWQGWMMYDRLVLELQDGRAYELGFRSDGTVVWRRAN